MIPTPKEEKEGVIKDYLKEQRHKREMSSSIDPYKDWRSIPSNKSNISQYSRQSDRKKNHMKSQNKTFDGVVQHDKKVNDIRLKARAIEQTAERKE